MRRVVRVALLAAFAVAPLRADIFDYLHNGDTSFAWSVAEGGRPNLAILSMTSQTWQNIVWKHQITIFRPAEVKHPDACVLLITGGSFSDGNQAAQVGGLLANQLGVHLAVLWQIPNQPLFDNLREDDLIAYTFSKALETGDMTGWPLLFPMAKSAVRAMDALQAWSEQELGAKFTRFITTGASKRGWTTWFTGAIDDRVVGIMPMVYDNLNLGPQMAHQKELWGHYSPQIEEYTRRGLQDFLQTAEGSKFGALVDPFTLRERINKPKLIVNGTNDLYWTLDALNLYRDQLLGPTYQLYVPNSGHGLQDVGRVLAGLGGFVNQVLGGLPEPVFRWQHTKRGDGTVGLTVTAPMATKVEGWTAVAAATEFGTAQWESTPLQKAGDDWSFDVRLPEGKALAVFAEATFDFGGIATPRSTTLAIYPAGN